MDFAGLYIQVTIFALVFQTSISGNIFAPTTIKARDQTPLKSANGDFSFGFLPSSTHPSLLTAGLFFSSTPIWKPVSDAILDGESSIEFESDGNLRLANGSGFVMWESNTKNQGITTATLESSGNLVLKDKKSNIVWSSFDNPTDTIVQKQNFTVGKILRSGLYSFTLLNTGNITLTWNRSIIYWNIDLNSIFVGHRSFSSAVITLETSGILKFFDPSLSSPVPIIYSNDYDTGNVFRFLRLDEDGNLRTYSSNKGDGSITATWTAIQDQCEVFGWCGDMGICSYNGSMPICSCPSQNFEFNDVLDRRKGCRRKTELKDCPGNQSMVQLDNTEFLTHESGRLHRETFTGISNCKLNCLQESSCIASTSLSDGSGQCLYKISNFVSGYQSPSLPSTSFVKVCSPALPNSPQPSPVPIQINVKLVIILVISTVIILILMESGLWWWFYIYNNKFSALSYLQYSLLEYASGAPIPFTYKELHRSTKGFSEKVGIGGFGSVYRGTLPNRETVAVKQLEGIQQGDKQFLMEVGTISSTHHLNLVRLIGFCSESRHRLLVYEFMKNGSLDHFIFSNESRTKLNWAARFNVALGAARGIMYLHEECIDCIVHCDIKPENILIDNDFNAKVSDFGLAKLVNSKDHPYRAFKSVRGTRGYLAPEWLANLQITTKSDVFSFGMVLLEIVGGRRNFDVSEETRGKRLSIWAYEEFDRGDMINIVDKRLFIEEEVDMDQVRRMVEVSFWCIQEQPSRRPTMGKVVQILEGISKMEKPPPPMIEAMISGDDQSCDMSSSTLPVHPMLSSNPKQ